MQDDGSAAVAPTIRGSAWRPSDPPVKSLSPSECEPLLGQRPNCRPRRGTRTESQSRIVETSSEEVSTSVELSKLQLPEYRSRTSTLLGRCLLAREEERGECVWQ